jgi:hypothetical protein
MVLVFCQWSLQFLPRLAQTLFGLVVGAGWFIFCATAAVFFALQIMLNFRLERSLVPKNLKLPAPPCLSEYTILNTLEAPGTFHKTQLHTHSSLSYDSKTPPQAVIASYQKDGYSFLVITDHDRRGDFSAYSTPEFLVLPGIEATIPVLFWPIPLGKHMVIVNPTKKQLRTASVQKLLNWAAQTGSVAIPAHLSWRGGAGTGRWYPEDLLELSGLRLVEIYSPHSGDPLDLTIWHKLIVKGGPAHPVWGVAVDDSHQGSIRHGWIMLKTPQIDRESLLAALLNGAFYSTSGPALEIQVENRRINVTSPGSDWIRYINAQNEVVGAYRTDQASYQTNGDEGFVRIEATDSQGRTAWSQPLWLVAVRPPDPI